MVPWKIPLLTEMFIRVIFTFSSADMIVVISFTSPILSMPVMLILTRKETSLFISHLTAMIRFPSFDMILMATGHLVLLIMMAPSGEWYPVTSSPGIGLQHFAISYDCSALSTFSLRRKGTFLSILP